MSSTAKIAYDANHTDTEQLWEIHNNYKGPDQGRHVLNKAAVIFITATWESFVEDLAMEAFDFMLANVATYDKVPVKVRAFATQSIFDQKDSRKVWELADNGWRTVLTAHREATRQNWLGSFNTPKWGNVDKLYDSLLGITSVSAGWYWQNMAVDTARTKLDEYIRIRGNIAHRVSHDETVYRSWGSDYSNHIQRLVRNTEDTVKEHLHTITGIAPW